MGSMNMPGISLSLLNLTNVAADCAKITTVEHLIELIDAPHTSVAWPATQNIYPVPKALATKTRHERYAEEPEEEKKEDVGGPKVPGGFLLRVNEHSDE